MSTNGDLAAIFHQMASVLELTGANAFRVNAHRRVARILEELVEDVATIANVETLTAIDGIGAASAAKIIEFVETGAVEEAADLLEEIPPGLLDVLEVPGLGPKKVRLLWQEADVTDIASLRAAIDAGSLEDLPRMGAKTIANITDALEFMATAGDRMRIGDAMPLAEEIVARLEDAGATQAQFAGSLRRGRETIGDIDILAVGDDEVLAEAFCTVEGVTKVLARGSTKCSIRLNAGVQVDLRIVEAAAFGAALLYFTGSKDHNVLLRERAIAATMRLNEYGLFRDDGEAEPPQARGIAPVAATTEEDIYAALDLPWQPPEVREHRGELEPRETLTLIELDDVRGDLHCHTVASDGALSIKELAAAAKAAGYAYVGVTDHSRAAVQANGLDEDRLRVHVDAIRAVDASVKGIRVLAGSEVDILGDGRLDYEDEVLAELDIVIASPHVALGQSPEKATARLLAAIEHPLVHVLGHPTGRLVNRRPGLEPDMATLIAAAVEHDTALEINANHWRLDLRDVHVRAAVEAGALLSINTDLHGPDDFDQLRYGVLTARRGWLTPKQCINCWTTKRLLTWLDRA